ncbi:putative disease resistance protein RGA3 [Pistacia vera]|uniref:putative disease resistance protein RGA3 n=1 Tax=Pistacia vera TaxID=55513 RepID=UPI001263CAE4|nr:putative disease resistance protein RGA3 [Pistacia vera]
MAESFPSTIAANILTKMDFLAFAEIRLSSRVRKEITKDKQILCDVKDAVLNAEAQQAQNCKLQIGLEKLSELLYDAEDVLDELKCEVLAKQVSKLSAIIYYGKIKDIRKKLDEKAAAIRSIYDENQQEFRRVYSGEMGMNNSFLGTSKFFRRDEDKENIVHFLMEPNREDERVSVIPIVGTASMGKTTLATLVYCDKRVDETHFFLFSFSTLSKTSKHLVRNIALFVATYHENEELENVGLQYLKELIFRCFFHDIKIHGNYFTFKMYNFVHDLVKEVAQSECKVIDLRIHYRSINARHLSFIGCENCIPNVSFSSNKLRTINMQSIQFEQVSESFVNTWTSNFKYVRLLCLSGLQFEVLPDSVGALKHLTCLDLSWNLILKKLCAGICKLRSLQILRLLGCSRLKNFPNNMGKMIGLRYLEMTTTDRHLPQIGVECFSSLRYLHLYNYHHLESISEVVQSLTSLRTLILKGCDSMNSLLDDIQHLKRLEKFVIYSCLTVNLQMGLQGKDFRLNLKVFIIYDLEGLEDLPQMILEGSANI